MSLGIFIACVSGQVLSDNKFDAIEVSMKNKAILFILLSFTALLAGPLPVAISAEPAAAVSGRLAGGLRILPVPANGQNLKFTVYRGDYIKFELAESADPGALAIPQLNIHQTVPRDLARAPYFKMKQTGSFAFTLGNVSGHIHVREYRQEKYAEVSAADAATIIATRTPLILDVRTPGEFKRGRLKDSVLIPVQVLQQNLDKLAAYKDREILVYCATGNRSTVASKILIDNGFSRITNLRYGIVDWYKKKYPIIQ